MTFRPWSTGVARVLLCPPSHAFRSEHAIASEWRSLGFAAPPRLEAARAEFQTFKELIASKGISIALMGEASGLTLDALYPRDAAVMTPNGAITGGNRHN